MFIKLNQRRGQNTAEYAILIGVIVAAAIAMQIYIRRGLQARVKDAVDYSKTGMDQGSGLNIFSTSNLNQYEPYYYTSNMETYSNAQTSEQLQIGGGVNKDSTQEYTQRTGNQVYANYATANTP